MASLLDEDPPYSDSGGIPLVGGKIFIGLVNLDPVLNPKNIFSDPELTNALANPQTINADGRATFRIFTDGEYSLKVEDINGGQHLQQLRRGEAPGGQTVNLTNVQGTDNITADASPAITSLVDQTQYLLQAIGANGGAVTLKIGSTAVTPVLQNVDQQIQKNKIQDTQTVIVVFNKGATQPEDFFEWVNQSDKVIYLTKAVALLSATTTLIWDALGNFIDMGLGASPVTSFGTAPQAGAFKKIKIADNGIVFQHTPGVLECPGGQDILAAVEDNFEVIAGTNTQAIIRQYQRATAIPSKGAFKFTGDIDLAAPAAAVVTLIDNLLNVETIEIDITDLSYSNNAAIIQIGGAVIQTSGYLGAGVSVNINGNIVRVNNSNGFTVGTDDLAGGSTLFDFHCVLKHMGSNLWAFIVQGNAAPNAGDIGGNFGQGRVTLPDSLTKVVITSDGTPTIIDTGTANIRYK